jgi:hypothetical protein
MDIYIFLHYDLFFKMSNDLVRVAHERCACSSPSLCCLRESAGFGCYESAGQGNTAHHHCKGLSYIDANTYDLWQGSKEFHPQFLVDAIRNNSVWKEQEEAMTLRL